MPKLPDGTTFHTDWWGAWDDKTMAAWTNNCIDKMLNCSDGVLGDGNIMKRGPDYALVANPRLVPMPVAPREAMSGHEHMMQPDQGMTMHKPAKTPPK
jgi:hypothetical protein